MNQDSFEKNWPEMRVQVQGWWDELTDEDLNRVQGKAEQIVALLQKSYGTSRRYTEKEYSRRLASAELG
ncbi:MAG: CsbD family protein [Chloroflexi bacterium]|nr:CsbD family protein [Chloroflexota bacterium]MDA0244471.1 CsbD family protein [Chloroflexota bacterium]